MHSTFLGRRMMMVGAVLAVLLACGAYAQDGHDGHAAPEAVTTAPEWDAETLDLFASLPVQDGGRIKPLDTYAQFTMLRLNGKRSFTTEDGRRLKPTEWMLNCLFYPEVTDQYAHFIVDDVAAVTALGIETHDERRGRYSYTELLPGREKLMQLAMQYSEKDAKDRTPHEQQILNLAHNARTYEMLRRFMGFAGAHYHLDPQSAMGQAVGENAAHATTADMLRHGPGVFAHLSHGSDDDAAHQELRDHLLQLERRLGSSNALSLFPPDDPEVREWRTPADVMVDSFKQDTPPEAAIGMLAHLEQMCVSRTSPPAFSLELGQLHDAVVSVASARGEYGKVPVELAFYRGKYLFYSQWLYVLSFVLVAISWLAPNAKWLQRLLPPAVAVPTILLIIAIVFRCIIRGRPPVSTLYETLLFTTATAVVVAIVMEYINRQRIAVAIGAALGTIGLFIAYRYEIKEGVDTMPSLVAVLDTNFWLATHVTTITLGYGAGMLASALAHIYVLGKLVGLKRNQPAFYASLSKMVYGVVCFCLLFSIVGTVLGGIWANDSWGRFWGWDPKENGALLICIWGLIMLHARLGGYIKDLGMSLTSIMLGMIVAFSWWGVNLLGVGLHSYGFTSGIMRILLIFWGIESVIIALGFVTGRMERLLSEAREA